MAAIKQAIVAYGAVTAYVYVDRTFQAYTGGVYNNTKTYRYTNHQIQLVGWDDGKGAWLLKNSWGTGWGAPPATCGSPTRPAGSAKGPPGRRTEAAGTPIARQRSTLHGSPLSGAGAFFMDGRAGPTSSQRR